MDAGPSTLSHLGRTIRGEITPLGLCANHFDRPQKSDLTKILLTPQKVALTCHPGAPTFYAANRPTATLQDVQKDRRMSALLLSLSAAKARSFNRRRQGEPR